MTTVEFGGGPTLGARQQFANVKEGGEIPKYAGHVHQLRFQQGHTFTEETHRVAKELPLILTRSKTHVPKKSISTQDLSDPYVSREFPDGLIPGYAGYVPQRKFQHGNRYRVETDVCSISSKNSLDDRKQKAEHLKSTINSYKKTPILNNETVVKHFLDYHRALHPNDASQQDDRRSFVEAPIPGYQGFIPRLDAIEVGVGTRYNQATKRALDRFAFETRHSTTNFSAAADFHPPFSALTRSASLSPSLGDLTQQRPITIAGGHRIYQRTGIVPRYMGYVPQRKYRCGQTFGDTTRELPVCKRGSSSHSELRRAASLHQTDVF